MAASDKPPHAAARAAAEAPPAAIEPTRLFRYQRSIAFGDCDPAGIAFYPNFYRWFDEAVHSLMNEIGWDWRKTKQERGWLGLPCAEASARFIRPVTHGQSVHVESRVLRFEPRRIVFSHRVLRGDVLLCEGEEKRFVGLPHPENPDRVLAIDAPLELQLALTRLP